MLDIDRRRHVARVVLAGRTSELVAPYAEVDLDVVSLQEAVERLPALREVVMDFEGVRWPCSEAMRRRVRERMEGSEAAMGFLEGRLGWSVDGLRIDPKRMAVVENAEKRADSGEKGV